MHSVRLRITLLATLATAAAVTVVAVVLLAQVRGSLLAEIDDALTDQIIDYDEAIVVRDDIDFARRPGDIETLFVVFDSAGVVLDANDVGVSGVEVRDALDLDLILLEPWPLVDLSLASPTETPGSDDMRATYTLLANLETDDELYVLFGRTLGGVDRTVAGIRNALLVGVPLLVAFVALLAWWLTGRSLRPVDRMRVEVDDITSTDLGRRVSEPASTDEIGQLASTMNRMLERLELAQASQEQFVSDAAHELRTPLASIAAQLDVDAAHPASADHLATAGNVRLEVSRLQALIDGLLASARGVESGEVQQPLVDLDVLASDAVARLVRPDGITIEQSGIGAGTVRGDEAALASVVDNLLANAYRHATSLVYIAVGTDADGVWLAVDDDGAGVAEADRERVFERFVRLDEARSRERGGSGLGLALVREAVQRHRGVVWVEASVHGGARFIVRLPGS